MFHLYLYNKYKHFKTKLKKKLTKNTQKKTTTNKQANKEKALIKWRLLEQIC